MIKKKSLLVCVVALAFGLLQGCAHQRVNAPQDPIEPVNRKVHDFNMGLDRYILAPVSSGYAKVTPAPVRRSIGNFFTNLGTPRVAVNNLLQGKPQQAAQDFSRMVFNTTLGIAGLFDVASDMGIPKHDEDFGQTLGVWGFGEGIYLVMPLLGPGNLRDVSGTVVDMPLGPMYYVDGEQKYMLTALNAVNSRANFAGAMRQLQQAFDPYAFLRASYIQRRQLQVRDGRKAEESEEFGDEFDDDF